MTLYFEDEGAASLPLDCEAVAREVAQCALDFAGCPYEAELNLLLTMNEQIRRMNREFRKIDRATDVLSFPMIEYEVPGEFDFLADTEDNFNPETGELLLGDIVISKEKVLDQADAYGHTALREYAFLIAHSVLHLSGYDHIGEDDRLFMEELQEKILQHLTILR